MTNTLFNPFKPDGLYLFKLLNHSPAKYNKWFKSLNKY